MKVYIVLMSQSGEIAGVYKTRAAADREAKLQVYAYVEEHSVDYD